ncbi:uncharacterized protein [Asterias amurensis]|uniref:uncharacterized protein n=1 Tax=Asterias amurensis TaxID=7602 RepID=UPI003AB56C27
MNSSDPLTKDRGLVSSHGEHETSLKLHRRNSIQRERLDQELRRLDKEQEKCIRRSHIEICSLSRYKKNLVRDLGRLSFSEVGTNEDANGDTITDEALKPTGERKRKFSFPPATPADAIARRISLPALFPDGSSGIVKKDLFLDKWMTREINRLKKASMRSGKDNSNDLDSSRKGIPRIPANAWYHDNQQVAKARERSVFDRLSSESGMNSKPCGEFLKEHVALDRSIFPCVFTVTTWLPTGKTHIHRKKQKMPVASDFYSTLWEVESGSAQ